MDSKFLKNIGLSQNFIAESDLYNDLSIGRVVSQSRNLYKTVTEKGEVTAEISGKFRFEVHTLSEYPAVGDFVLLDRIDDGGGNAIIRRVLPRKSAFIRKAAGTSQVEQVVAANIDTLFLCMSLNRDYNLRRMERYLGIAWDSGATPVIVLTKADLCGDRNQRRSEAEGIACGAEVLMTSSLTDEGWASLQKYLGFGQTVAFIGSSGVGKSTMINRLLGRDLLQTRTLRNDDKGRHATTRRELIFLPNGSMVIDTPGMRELGIERTDLAKAFSDIDDLAARCRFRDCTHTKEPYCAVLEAASDGRLSPERLASYLKLKKEARYEGLNSRQIETEKITSMFAEIGGIKNARKFVKEKSRSRQGYQ